MKQSGAWVSILALFCVGILIGGLGTHLLYATGRLGESTQLERRMGRGKTPPTRGHERLPRRPGGGLEALQLTDDQRQQLRTIVEETRLAGRQMRESWRPQVEELMQESAARIDGLLTDEQKETWQSLREDHPRVLERMFLGRPRGASGAREGRDERLRGKGKAPRFRPGTHDGSGGAPRGGPPGGGPPPGA